jgi:hypothetical protein
VVVRRIRIVRRFLVLVYGKNRDVNPNTNRKFGRGADDSDIAQKENVHGEFDLRHERFCFCDCQITEH